MNIPVRDMYINVLEKRAAEAAAIGPDFGTDNQAVANGEVDANNKDQRAQLEPLFGTTKATEKATTKQVGQLLPTARKTEGTQASNPLLKVAHHTAFFGGLRQTDFFKTASLDYIRVAYSGFEDELEKTALPKFPSLGKLRGGTKLKPQAGAQTRRFAEGSVVRQAPRGDLSSSNMIQVPGGGFKKVTPIAPAGVGGRMTREQVEQSLSQVPRRAPSPISAADARRFNKAPQQVGTGVWKLAQILERRLQQA